MGEVHGIGGVCGDEIFEQEPLLSGISRQVSARASRIFPHFHRIRTCSSPRSRHSGRTRIIASVVT